MQNDFEEIVIRLAYPFTHIISPHSEQMEKYVHTWIKDYSCLSDDLKSKLLCGKFGNLACHFFPLATFEQLIVMTRWNLCFFAFDDCYGPKYHDELVLLCNRAVEILAGQNLKESDNEIFRQMAIIRNELLQFTDLVWMERFIGSMKLFFEGMKIDTAYSYQHEVKYPKLHEYIFIREKIVATYPLLDMIDIENNFILPPGLVTHSYIMRIRQLACRLVSWSNDIFSLQKELNDHEAMNLVAVLMNQNNYDLHAATSSALEIHQIDLQEFIVMKANIPDFGELTPNVRNYVESVALLLQGHINWYSYTKRY